MNSNGTCSVSFKNYQKKPSKTSQNGRNGRRWLFETTKAAFLDVTFILDAHFIANSSEAAIFKSPFPNPLKTDQRDQRKPKLTDGAEESECEQVEESSVHLDLGWRNLQRRHMSPLEGPAGVCTYNHPPPRGAGLWSCHPPGFQQGGKWTVGSTTELGSAGLSRWKVAEMLTLILVPSFLPRRFVIYTRISAPHKEVHPLILPLPGLPGTSWSPSGCGSLRRFERSVVSLKGCSNVWTSDPVKVSIRNEAAAVEAQNCFMIKAESSPIRIILKTFLQPTGLWSSIGGPRLELDLFY